MIDDAMEKEIERCIQEDEEIKKVELSKKEVGTTSIQNKWKEASVVASGSGGADGKENKDSNKLMSKFNFSQKRASVEQKKQNVVVGEQIIQVKKKPKWPIPVPDPT